MFKKTFSIIIVILIVFGFGINKTEAASNPPHGIHERIDLVMYDMNEHTYFAYAYDEQDGCLWELPIEVRAEFDQHELDELQSIYNGLQTYIQYDSNNGSTNNEDWTLTGWSVITGK